jgi:GTPase-associated system helical domain
VNAAIERMGKLYGKLGLDPSPTLVEARGTGIVAASEDFVSTELPDVLGTAFGLGRSDQPLPLAAHFSATDPTFDVRQNQSEGALLATTLLSYEIQSGSEFANHVALILTTAVFGGLRPLKADPDGLGIAAQALSDAQSKKVSAPVQRTHQTLGKSTVEAVGAIPDNGQIDASQIKPVLNDLSKYSEARAKNAAASDNELLSYIKRLEEEMQTHWWVIGAWSNLSNRPFRDLDAGTAAILAGIELASKTTLELGLFAAPALLDMVLMKDRASPLAEVTISAAATLLDRDYRTNEFGALIQTDAAPWLPLTTAMGLAAESNDEKDWEARFKRLTGINPKAKIKPLDLAVQIYRERLAAPLFG